MHWSLKLILDMPRAVLEFRRNHISSTHLQKIEKKQGLIVAFREMLKDSRLSPAEVEIYIDLLPEVMEDTTKFSPEDLQWFFSKGEEYGVLKRVEEPTLPDNSWKKWEEQ